MTILEFLNDNSNKIVNSMLIFFSLISFMLNFLLILIHCRQTPFLQGFFIIVCIQIILEALINVIILVINILFLCNISLNYFLLLFQILFYFCYTTNILFNNRIIIFLMTSNKEKQEQIEYDSEDNFSSSSINKRKKSHSSSIAFFSDTFKSIYIIPFLISIILTGLYLLSIYFFKIEKEGEEDIPYILGSLELFNLSFYSFHLIYFVFSLIYLILSVNKEQISKHIHLKSFSIYCLFSSIISLSFPVISILKKYLINAPQYIFKYLFVLIFLFHFSISCWFRYRCYYIQNILGNYGNGFCSKLRYGLKILFCCKRINQPDFIDFNSNFVYHSLSNINDFNRLELATDFGETIK